MEQMGQMKRCRRCGQINQADARQCSRCQRTLVDSPFLPATSKDTTITLPQMDTKDPSGQAEEHPRSLENATASLEISEVNLSTPTEEHLGGSGRALAPSNINRAGLFQRKKDLFLANLWQRKILVGSIIILLVLVVLIPIVSQLWPKSSSNGLGVTKASNGEYIGVNDGSYMPFDIGPQRADSSLKEQAAQALVSGNPQQAISLWNQCLSGADTNDAEVKIYIENQKALAFPYVTLIVGLDFLQPFPDLGSQRVLQGAYLAQKEFNEQHSNLKLRLLLANTGGDLSYIPSVVQRIIQVARTDTTVVGILGWQTSARTQNVLDILRQAGVRIPVLSESATTDELTGAFPNFFRIVPPNHIQVQGALPIAEKTLHATQAIVFADPTNLFSQNAGRDFENGFTQAGDKVLSEVHFTAGKTSTAEFSQLLKQALKNIRDTSHLVIFFAGVYDDHDAGPFQDALADYPKLQVISGDGGYTAHKSIYGRWYLIGQSFHNEWSAFMGNNAPFFQNFSDEYHDPSGQHTGYDYDFPHDTAIVSYDATRVLSDGIDIAFRNLKGTNTLTPQDLENALSQITGAQAWQGISGLINFGPDHDPINKAVVVLMVDSTGHFQMVCVQGHFSANSDSSPLHCPA